MMSAINNEGTWIFICFILLCALTYKYLRHHISAFIDTRVAQVSVDLDNAIKAYDQAVSILQDAENNLKKARDKAHTIVNVVTLECENIKATQLSLFKAQLEKKEKDLESSIKQMYDLAEIELRHKIIDSAQLLVIEYLKTQKQSDSNQATTIANMIKDLKIN